MSKPKQIGTATELHAAAKQGCSFVALWPAHHPQCGGTNPLSYSDASTHDAVLCRVPCMATLRQDPSCCPTHMALSVCRDWWTASGCNQPHLQPAAPLVTIEGEYVGSGQGPHQQPAMQPVGHRPEQQMTMCFPESSCNTADEAIILSSAALACGPQHCCCSIHRQLPAVAQAGAEHSCENATQGTGARRTQGAGRQDRWESGWKTSSRNGGRVAGMHTVCALPASASA